MARMKRRGDLCPSCERFIGPADRCPYCGEASAKSPFIRGLRIAALVLAVLGLALLFRMASQRELPVQAVGAVNPMMNFAFVRVIGTVRYDARVIERGGTVDYVSFPVDDGTGRIRVQVYARAAQRLVAEDRVPRRGQVVDVAGSLNISAEGMPRLRLATPAQLKVLSALPEHSAP